MSQVSKKGATPPTSTIEVLLKLSTCEYQLGRRVELSKQRAGLDLRKFSLSQREVPEWNELPQEVVDATSMNRFKSRLDKFRQQRYGH